MESFVSLLVEAIRVIFVTIVGVLFSLINEVRLLFDDSRDPNSCRVYRVLGNRAFMKMKPNSLNNFILWLSNETVSISRIFDDDIILYHVDEKWVYLAELPGPIQDTLNSTVAPFGLVTTQYIATSIIRVKMDRFKKAVDEKLGKKLKTRVVILNGLSRSGTTLTCNLAHFCTDRVLSLSEPGYFHPITMMKRVIPEEKFRVYLNYLLRFAFRPVSDKDIFFINPRGGVTLTTDITKEFPEVTHTFISRRNHLKAVESITRVSLYVTQDFIPRILTRFMVILWKFGLAYLPEHTTDQIWAESFHKNSHIFNGEEFELVFMLWASTMHGYNRIKAGLEGDVHFQLEICFEDLLKNREEHCRKLSDLLGFGEEGAKRAMKGFERDSQKGTGLAQESLRRFSPIYTRELIRRFQQFIEKVGGIPSIDDYIDTITVID